MRVIEHVRMLIVVIMEAMFCSINLLDLSRLFCRNQSAFAVSVVFRRWRLGDLLSGFPPVLWSAVRVHALLILWGRLEELDPSAC